MGAEQGPNNESQGMGAEAEQKQKPIQPTTTEKLLPWDAKTAQVLDDWYIRATAAQYGHQAKSDLSRKRSLLIGIPLVVLSTLVGTTVFAAASDHSVTTGSKVLVGSVSILAAVLAGIQTLLSYSQLAEKHRIAAFRYANLRRDIALTIVRKDSDEVEKIRREMDKIGADAPLIGEPTWSRYLRRAERETRPWRDGADGQSGPSEGRPVTASP
jgi:hypothetical protein